MAVKIKDALLNILKNHSSNKEAFNDIEFKLVPPPQTPLTINDYLVNKRPSLRLLSLPDNKSDDNNNNNEPIKTPSQDAQGCWYELLSPTQVLTGEQNLNNDKKQQKTKKKKCCGNQKAQCLRRRERRQQQKMNHNTNHMDQSVIFIEDDNDDSENEEQQ
ncbi:unnamed protein product [Rotaria sordida]|uniref:Uncharacterized protein n=1 Tax=Rotaria sordida TaxID=392033 RepID=A0A815M201_9BILA|nr:unnamed protein product [Rotaria sordida]